MKLASFGKLPHMSQLPHFKIKQTQTPLKNFPEEQKVLVP